MADVINTYVPLGLKRSRIKFERDKLNDNFTIQVQVSDAMSTILDSYELRNSKIIFRRTGADDAHDDSSNVQTVFLAYVDSWDLQDNVLSIVCSTNFISWNAPYPNRLCSAFCPCVFKDERCEYIGSDTSCVHTLTDCEAKTSPVAPNISKTKDVYFPRKLFIKDNYIYIASYLYDGLKIIKKSDFSDISETSPATNCQISSVYVSGDYAYITDIVSDKLYVYDISDPSSPVLKDSVGITDPTSVFVLGNYAYVGNSIDTYGLSSFYVVNVTDPTNISIVGTINGDGGTNKIGKIYGIYVSGNYAYVTCFDTNSLVIIDISTPASPSITGTLSDSANYLDGARSVFVSGNYAYVAAYNSDALTIINISTPASPSKTGQITGSANYLDGANNVYISGSYAYVASRLSNALAIIDIATPSNPTLIGSISGTENYLDGAWDVSVSGHYAYVIGCFSCALIKVGLESSDGGNSKNFCGFPSIPSLQRGKWL